MPARTIRTTALALLVSFGLVEVASAYYNPRSGRFVNRDPIGEQGAVLIRHVALADGAQRPNNGAGIQRPDDSHGFVPRDLIAIPGGPNRFACVRNKPTNSVDPLGLDETPSKQCTLNGSPVAWAFNGANLENWEAVSGEPVSETETSRDLFDETVIIHLNNRARLRAAISAAISIGCG